MNVKRVLYQARFQPHATWSQGTDDQFLQAANISMITWHPPQEIRVKVGDSIPEALAQHAGRPVRLTCNGPEWVCEVF